MKRHGTVRLLALLALFSLPFFTGCDADDPVAPDPVGTCVINPSPDALEAPWTLVGPDSYSVSATGDQTLNELVPGDYTITWGEVGGWDTPPSESQTLLADATATFTGTYVGQIGVIVIDPDPDAIDAPWTLTGPGSFASSGNGDVTLNNMAVGDYTLTWGVVDDWVTPAAEMAKLAAEAMVTFAGQYTEPTGTLVLDITPDSLDAPWFLLGPDGYQASGNGDAVLPDLTIGEYYVSFGPVAGWIAPLSTDASLLADDTLTFTGVYVEDPGLPFPGTENQLMANFRTTYEDMNFDTMADLLHADFITILQPSTTQEFPDVGATLDLTEELRIAERMFSGQPVTDPDGALVQAISIISFNIFEQQGAWVTSPPNDVIPNARFALFDVTFLFGRPGASTLKVEGQIKFYVAGRDSVVDGLTKTYWEMIGQQDLTNSGKAIENNSWGSVKALFR
ncbi:MAG: hypothetical protein QNL91_11900 [Candidatus Krumholzibacteria bacterium]|nr:hypothetical protein [Candidatus Krumholzibacteria bacterium]